MCHLKALNRPGKESEAILSKVEKKAIVVVIDRFLLGMRTLVPDLGFTGLRVP